MDKTIEYSVVKCDRSNKQNVKETMVYEYPLSIFLNGKHVTTLLCTPKKIKALSLGFLRTQGIIKSIDDIENFQFDKENGIVRIDLRSNLYNQSLRHILPAGYNEDYKEGFYNKLVDFLECKVAEENDIRIKANCIYELMKENLSYSDAFRKTGGVHCIALSDGKKIITVCEDVARHNAMDKVIGEALINDILLEGKIILVSGRVSFEMILKTSKFGIPIIVSKSAPTNMSVELAKRLNVTLIGFARGERMNIYSSPFRIEF